MHEVICAAGGPSMAHVMLDTPPLAILLFGGLAASAAVYRVAHQLALDNPVDRVTYDGLRAVGFYCGWLSVWSLAAIVFPCWFLSRPESFVGLWYWGGVPLSILQLAWWLNRHATRRTRASKEPS